MSSGGFRFDRYLVDFARASLLCGDDEIELRPKSFNVLRYLVENPGRVVTKDELIRAVWKDVFVTDDSLVQCVREIRHALKDDAQQLVKTIPRRGYLFNAPVTPVDTAILADAGGIPNINAGEKLPPRSIGTWQIRRSRQLIAGGLLLFGIVVAIVGWWVLDVFRQAEAPVAGPPSIAVLFFATDQAGGERSHDYFSDGLTDDVIAALGRFGSLRVLSRASLNRYKGTAWEPQQLGRDLNVRYIVDGSVRRSGDRLRVSARLTDAAHHVLLWSESYDEEFKDVFAVQDRLTRSIVGRLAIRISRIEQARAAAKRPGSMEAYDYVLRGRERLASITRADNLEARRLFRIAAELDPRYASAFVGLGHSYQNDLNYGWTEWPDDASRRAYEFAHRAIVLDENDPAGHLLLSRVYLVRKEHGLALAEADRGIGLNPNDADGHAIRGTALVWAGRPNDAIAAFETAGQFDPNHSRPHSLANIGIAYFLLGRYDDAVRAFELSVGRHPEFIVGAIGLAATYGTLSKRPEAAHAADMVRRLDPFFTSASFGALFADEAHRLRMVEGLQKAGL